MPAAKSAAGAKAAKPKSIKYSIDVKAAVEQKVLVPSEFEEYLASHIKVANKVNNLGEAIKVEAKGSRVDVTTSIPLSKRYVKYLTKRYLKKLDMRDYLRVISTSKTGYELRFFKIADEEEADDE